MTFKLVINNAARIEVCEEAMSDAMPLLSYCIEHHPLPDVRANLDRIRLAFPMYVRTGNAEVISTACGFIKEVYDELTTNVKAVDTGPTQALLLLGEINSVIKDLGERFQLSQDIGMINKVHAIVTPLQMTSSTPAQFIAVGKVVLAQLKAMYPY